MTNLSYHFPLPGLLTPNPEVICLRDIVLILPYATIEMVTFLHLNIQPHYYILLTLQYSSIERLSRCILIFKLTFIWHGSLPLSAHVLGEYFDHTYPENKKVTRQSLKMCLLLWRSQGLIDLFISCKHPMNRSSITKTKG